MNQTEILLRIGEIKEAEGQAKNTLRNLDHAAPWIAQLLLGRLRHCNIAQLRAFKQDLQDFDARTGKWRNK